MVRVHVHVHQILFEMYVPVHVHVQHGGCDYYHAYAYIMIIVHAVL